MTIKLLVNHSSGNNLGDMAMIEGVIRRLLQSKNNIHLFVKDNQSLPKELWNFDNVTRVEFDLLPEPIRGVPFLENIPYVRRYKNQIKTIGIRSCHLMLDHALKASDIRIGNQPDSTTLGDLCNTYDAMHFVGMGGLTDIFIHDTWYYCCLIHTFTSQGKPVIFTGQQIGPIYSWTTKKLIQRALKKVEFVGLREPTDSLAFCEQAKLNPNRFTVMGDDSFGLPATDLKQVKLFLSRYDISPGQFIAVNVRIADYAGKHTKYYIQQIADLLSNLSRRYDLAIVVVPIALDAYDSDIASGYLLAEAMGEERIKVLDKREELTATLIKGVLGQAYAAIGVSYHFCTFALSQGVPAICIFDGAYYSQKARGISRFWGDERLALPLDQLKLEESIRQISELIEDKKFRDFLPERAQRAIKEWEDIFDFRVQRMLSRCKNALL